LAGKRFERTIEVLDVTRHARDTFSCGVESLDRYFRSRARQDRDKCAAAVFVMADGPTVIGYYTLSAFAIHTGDLPDELRRKLPRYPTLPATLIGRLAVDKRYHKKGFGEELLPDALRRSLDNTSHIGSIAVVVEAENENAIRFYMAYGFLQFPDRPTKLFLSMQTIRDLFKK
jgi:GNAT superfamily N-acetyltransferase